MGTRTSRRAFGHFGGTGTFVWVDPEPGVALRRPGAKKAWPALSDAVLDELAR